MTVHDTLLHRQAQLEIEMAGLGRERYLSKVRKEVDKERGFETRTGRTILEAAVGPVTEGLQAFLDETFGGRPGPRARAAVLIKDMDLEAVSYLGCRAILGRMMKPRAPVLMTLAVTVAKSVELEARFTAFKKADPAKYQWETKQLADIGSTEAHKAAVLTYVMNKQGIAWDRWVKADMVHLGVRLIELFCSHTGLAVIEQAHQGADKNAPRDQYVVRLTERAEAWIAQSIKGGEELCPEYLPTIMPPKPWTSLEGGGYHTEATRPLPLVRRARGEHLALLKRADLSRVRDGINAIQNTPWQINEAVLDVMAHLASEGDGIAGLVPANDHQLPPRPVDIDTNPEALREWKWAARDTYEANIQLRQDRLRQQTLLNLAERFRGEPSIYFPHNLDFRGRAYPIPLVLHPQGSDPVKALLRFAEGKPLGKSGARWLAIHGANCFGVDKVPFTERIAWVEEHRELIFATALDPLGCRWWTEADSPWCFLAFCSEWLCYDIGGPDFMSHLPVALDGSCNGLQHFSAMLLDSVGGSAVNLIPAPKPQDIYQVVADRVMEQLRSIASHSGAGTEKERWANAWLSFGIDRKVTKRPVMVLPYGGTPRSCLRYVDEAIRAKISAGQKHNFGDELKKAIGFLSSLVWESIGDVVIAARDAMAWLQKTARVVAKGNRALHWTTPSGFVGYQGYLDMKSRRIRTQIGGQMVKLRAFEETDKIDVSKQATSVSPNYVHSMDASAMVLTVAELAEEGLTSFAMIHDSYATHACDTERLAETLRAVFVRMYEQDPLAHFRDEVFKANPECALDQIEEIPQKGTLQLSSILKSDFFFA